MFGLCRDLSVNCCLTNGGHYTSLNSLTTAAAKALGSLGAQLFGASDMPSITPDMFNLPEAEWAPILQQFEQAMQTGPSPESTGGGAAAEDDTPDGILTQNISTILFVLSDLGQKKLIESVQSLMQSKNECKLESLIKEIEAFTDAKTKLASLRGHIDSQQVDEGTPETQQQRAKELLHTAMIDSLRTLQCFDSILSQLHMHAPNKGLFKTCLSTIDLRETDFLPLTNYIETCIATPPLEQMEAGAAAAVPAATALPPPNDFPFVMPKEEAAKENLLYQNTYQSLSQVTGNPSEFEHPSSQEIELAFSNIDLLVVRLELAISNRNDSLVPFAFEESESEDRAQEKPEAMELETLKEVSYLILKYAIEKGMFHLASYLLRRSDSVLNRIGDESQPMWDSIISNENKRVDLLDSMKKHLPPAGASGAAAAKNTYPHDYHILEELIRDSRCKIKINHEIIEEQYKC
jgi:hypothetical protein